MEARVKVKEVCNFISLKHIFSGVYARVGYHEGSFLVGSEKKKERFALYYQLAQFEAVRQQWSTTNEKNYTKGEDTCLFHMPSYHTACERCLNDNTQPRLDVKIYLIWTSNHQGIRKGKRYMNSSLIFLLEK